MEQALQWYYFFRWQETWQEHLDDKPAFPLPHLPFEFVFSLRGPFLFNTRETVAVDTPAYFATSFIVDMLLSCFLYDFDM